MQLRVIFLLGVGFLATLDMGCRKKNLPTKVGGSNAGTDPTANTSTWSAGPVTTFAPFQCQCTAAPTDRDGDCEPDAIEDINSDETFDAGDFSDLNNPDTDADGIPDGCEDWNHNGVVDNYPPESSPTSADSDGDRISDGLEDKNHNGIVDAGETSSTSNDSDNDGIPDSEEDRNHNGLWDCPEDPDEKPCETNAAAADSDNDGLLDIVELRSFAGATPNFRFCVIAGSNPCGGALRSDCSNDIGKHVFAGADGSAGTADDQTCPWQADSDGDGLNDGIEDSSADGRVSTGETDPRKPDSDSDGLNDGVEDTNKDGLWDLLSETDPTRLDSDGDGISDGIEDAGGCLTTAGPSLGPSCSGMPATGPTPCICGFWRDGAHQAFESDPRVPDTDGDGLRDGAEDRNGDGVCQLPAPRDVAHASDETCAFDNDSDGDSLIDGAEDVNGNGLIDAFLNETDARRADPDNDCLSDPYEIFTGTDPFRPDTDDDGLADGLETDRRLRFDQATRSCVPLSCGAQREYQSTTCPNPQVRDSDGDGFVDGFEIINGVRIGEDENADGCKALYESNPCLADTPQPPVIGDPTSTVCALPSGLDCSARDLRQCSTCDGDSCGGSSCSPGARCADNTPCKLARKLSEALICAEGNVRPVVLVRSAENDYSLALPGTRGSFGVPDSLFDFAPSIFKIGTIGHLFQSKQDDAIVNGTEPIRSVFGGITRMGTFHVGERSVALDSPSLTIVDGSGTGNLIALSSLSPSDVAAITDERLQTDLKNSGYLAPRVAGGTVYAHDDEHNSGRANATIVQRATDHYLVHRGDGGLVETAALARLIGTAILGGNAVDNALVPPTTYFRGPYAELKITYYRRVVKERDYDSSGNSILRTIVQFGALWAVADIDSDCSVLSGAARNDCRQRNESAQSAVDDLANGSALARVQAEVGRGCDTFDPKKAKADFLIVVDDSGSMQKNIIAIQRGARDVAFRLRANAENMDWRIGMTTSNMGGGSTHNAMHETYVPYGMTPVGTYPELNPAAPPTAADAFAAYQHTAFDNDGKVKPCEYGESYSAQNPLVSPYCCHYSDNNSQVNPLIFLKACCSLPKNAPVPDGAAFTAADFTLSDDDSANYGANFDQNDTLRCYDFPRFSEDLAGWAGIVSRYPSASSAAGNNPTTAQRKRNFNDYLCGKVADNPTGVYSPDDGAMPLYGARGHLWPPGFTGIDPNPRLDGANLLIRNADMLVTQMNRDCTGDDTGGNLIRSPRSRNGSGAEATLQAAKRAIERAVAFGRTNNTAAPDPLKLREDAPLITILLSDEEDFSTKFRNRTTDRDKTQLPAARCVNNGDLGCSVPYCQGCFDDAIEKGAASGALAAFAVPAARSYDEVARTLSKDTENGVYCSAPVAADAGSTAATVVSCSGGYCPAGATASAHYDGLVKVPANVDENLAASEGSSANGVPADVLNYTLDGSPVSCNGCGADCQPCMRFIRERQYIDFFGGQCSGNDVSSLAAPLPSDEPRRYSRPAATVSGGKLVLPLGPVYTITRTANLPGGAPNSCGSQQAGGDGAALRNIALSTGGAAANICPPAGASEPNFADFLDRIIVDAQGFGSPYRLRGNPISSTIRVGVMDRYGNFRLLKRSSVAGFDYNATTNTVAFFSKDAKDISNQVSTLRDAVVYVSYRVWERRCEADCPLGDTCAICTCSPGRPDCCTATPTFECQPPRPCPQGCGPCQTCDYETNKCRAVSACGDSCGSLACTSGASGPACGDCPQGTVPVQVPCVASAEGGACPAVPLTVCVTPQGQSNTGTSCAVTTAPACCGTSSCMNGEDCAPDCCGASKTCPDNSVCVLAACAGESCLPTAKCRALTGNQPPADACGICQAGTVCAPIPCGAGACPPKFACIAANAGLSASCDAPPECSCPGSICADCAAGMYCDLNQQCQAICSDPAVTLDQCCTDPSKQSSGKSCCPVGETYDPATDSCATGGYSCHCPPEYDCDRDSGRCIKRGN